MTKAIACFSRVIAMWIVLATVPAHAAGSNCNPKCPTYTTSARPTSIKPDPTLLQTLGDLFTERPEVLEIGADGSQVVDLRFGFTIGGVTYNSVTVSEDSGLLFTGGGQRAIIAPFVGSLSQLARGTTVDGYDTGRIYVQYGQNQPFADILENGDGVPTAYSGRELRSAVKIVWYGLATTDPATGAQVPVFAEVILTGDNQGNNSFAFRWGVPNGDGVQQGYGSYAGFVFPDQQLTFGGPYASNNRSTPSVFDMAGGRVLNLDVGGVPEPATWAMMLLGFAVIGASLRRRFRRGPGFGAVAQ